MIVNAVEINEPFVFWCPNCGKRLTVDTKIEVVPRSKMPIEGITLDVGRSHFCHCYCEECDEAMLQLDHMIAEAIIDLNNASPYFKTTYSCQGHYDDTNGPAVSVPYISFDCEKFIEYSIVQFFDKLTEGGLEEIYAEICDADVAKHMMEIGSHIEYTVGRVSSLHLYTSNMDDGDDYFPTIDDVANTTRAFIRILNKLATLLKTEWVDSE